jgi:hypothetical protein
MKNYSLVYVQNDSRAHLAPYSMGKEGGAFSPSVKRPECEADHSPPTSAKVKETWIYTSTPPYIFIA